MIVVPDDQSILVLASYRTGSTALCDYLAGQYKFKNYDELFHRTKPTDLYETRRNNKSIIKIMPDQIPEKYWDELLNYYIIGISRKSVIEQITSFYICHMTHVWHYTNTDLLGEYQVRLDQVQLENTCRYILDMNKGYQNLKHLCNQEIIYEEVNLLFNQSKYKVYNKPVNYNEISEAIKYMLPDRL
jgi:LPS sulfotransferase NodH